MQFDVICKKVGEYGSRVEYRWSLLADSKEIASTVQFRCKTAGDMTKLGYIPEDLLKIKNMLESFQQNQSRVNYAVLSLTDALANRPLPLFENPMLEKWWVDEICSRVATLRDAYKACQG